MGGAKRKIVDLSHVISPDMPVYPGTEQPELITGCTLEEAGFLEKKITMYSHTGTHVDAPAHLLKDAATLDSLTIEHFYGSALMLNFEPEPSSVIEVDDLEFYAKELEKVDFLLLHTGWSKYWGAEKYFSGYPVLSVEAAKWLTDFQLKGVGLETISADPADTVDYPVHKVLLQKNMVIVENLTNLSSLSVSLFEFCCFPLKFIDSDGSPVRAVAFV